MLHINQISEDDEYIDETKDPMHEIYDIIKVKKDGVIYPLNPKLVTDISEYFKPFCNLLFLLSKDLKFIGYSMNEFRLVIVVFINLYSQNRMFWKIQYHATASDAEADSGSTDSYDPGITI